MGGKKKTKWRKLPLEEFTKEIPPKTEKVPPNDVCQVDSTREEINYIPSNCEPSENGQYYTEPYENISALWYPTSCVVYNPAEVGLYSNYMMPLDACYYYYTMPEVPQMQDYVPVPYQEYTPALPKDTVYLLLPTQNFRPSQPVQNTVTDWQARRRRRRYEGYADYAAIPEKSNVTKSEERDRSNRTEQILSSRKSSSHYNNFKRITSETNKFSDFNSASEQNPSCSASIELQERSMSSTNINSVTGLMSVNKTNEQLNKETVENNQKFRKNSEVCGIHSKNNEKSDTTTGITIATETNSTSLSLKNECLNTAACDTEKEHKNVAVELSDISKPPSSSDPSNTPVLLGNKDTSTNKSREQSDKSSLINEVSGDDLESTGTEEEIGSKTVSITPVSITAGNVKDNLTKSTERNLQGSLPDILSTLNKPQLSETKCESDCSSGALPDAVENEKGICPKSKTFLAQTGHLPNILSSEALHNEVEMELKQLQSLHSLQANQSIYKLAYDESITDQSEADSRSPSPLDPESNIPSSLPRTEILVHEANSDSDAGSEDLELIPHRYESETFLNASKHVYINKLSLAVELLRTRESLPYDKEFKRVVGENQTNNIVPSVHSGGNVNLGFHDGSSSPNASNNDEQFETQSPLTSIYGNTPSQYQFKHSANSSNDSAIFSDIEFDSLEMELCESAKEAETQGNETPDNTEGIRAGYRRMGVQARHYFSPRTALSWNPCFCCIIM